MTRIYYDILVRKSHKSKQKKKKGKMAKSLFNGEYELPKVIKK